jgi:hypothetical protein
LVDSSTTGANDVTVNGEDDDEAAMTMPRAVEESFIVPLHGCYYDAATIGIFGIEECSF